MKHEVAARGTDENQERQYRLAYIGKEADRREQQIEHGEQQHRQAEEEQGAAQVMDVHDGPQCFPEGDVSQRGEEQRGAPHKHDRMMRGKSEAWTHVHNPLYEKCAQYLDAFIRKLSAFVLSPAEPRPIP
ncbi:hypothetical protein D3C73_1046310 [compost metagenome]